MTSIAYIFFCTFVEEKTFSSRLEICLQMSTKMSQNSPKVVHFIKLFIKNFQGEGGMPPDPTSICSLHSLNRSRNPSLFAICCSRLCIMSIMWLWRRWHQLHHPLLKVSLWDAAPAFCFVCVESWRDTTPAVSPCQSQPWLSPPNQPTQLPLPFSGGRSAQLVH